MAFGLSLSVEQSNGRSNYSSRRHRGIVGWATGRERGPLHQLLVKKSVVVLKISAASDELLLRPKPVERVAVCLRIYSQLQNRGTNFHGSIVS